MRPLCCDQPEALTQGYYPLVGSPVINAAPRTTQASIIVSQRSLSEVERAEADPDSRAHSFVCRVGPL